MKAILTHYSQENFLNVTGDDVVSFKVYFKTEKQPEAKLPYSLMFDDLMDFLKIHNPEVFNYIRKIRSDMHGYGPKHSKILKTLDDEGFDIEQSIREYVANLDATRVGQHYEWSENLAAMADKNPEQNQTKEALKSLDSLLTDDFRSYAIRFDAYKDALDQAIHETTFAHFPELFDKSKKHLAAYRHELVNTTLGFSSEIDKIYNSVFKPFWEEKYNESQPKEES